VIPDTLSVKMLPDERREEVERRTSDSSCVRTARSIAINGPAFCFEFQAMRARGISVEERDRGGPLSVTSLFVDLLSDTVRITYSFALLTFSIVIDSYQYIDTN